jgi:D-threo-aldose 1-dehydrogenase
MERRAIGTTGIAVTPVGFGTAALGGMPDTYGYSVDEATAISTLLRIFEGPVNLLDTSRNYGLGRSEARIGAAIRERGGLPEDFVISAKLDRDMETGRFDAAQVRRSAEESLEALGIEKFQILHLHDPEHGRDLEEVRRSGGALDELFKLKEEGLVDAAGIAMGRTDTLLQILMAWPFDIVLNHNRFTLLNRSATEVFDYAKSCGIAVFNAAPYAGGVLAKGSAETQKITYQDADEEGLEQVRKVEAICRLHDVPPGALALQFSMREPRILSTICGVSRPERVMQTLEWVNCKIDETAWRDCEAIEPIMTDPEARRIYVPG